MIEVFCEHAKQLPYAVGLQLVTDEEIGGEDGTGHQRRSGVLAEHFISGESTGFAVNTDAKGACWVKLTAHGVSAHGAYPWNGMNALHRLHKAIDAVMKIYPVPLKEVWRTSVNLAKIETKNDAFNKVPDEATAFLDIRFTADDVHFKSKKIALAFLKKIVGSGISIECAQWGPPHHADSSGTLVRSLHAAIKKHVKVQPAQKTHGASDARFYSDAKTHAVCFGPIGGGLHTTAEWVSIRSISVYKDILREYLQCLV
jgi:succinyl-diaminopimelate desuccinylase